MNIFSEGENMKNIKKFIAYTFCFLTFMTSTMALNEPLTTKLLSQNILASNKSKNIAKG